MVLASANCNFHRHPGPAPTVTTGWRTIELHWRPFTGVSPTPLRLQIERELKLIFGYRRSQGQLAKKASTRGHGAKGQWNQRIPRKSSNKIDNMIDVSCASSTDGEYCPNGVFMSFPVVPTWWPSWSSWSSTMRRSLTSLTPRDSAWLHSFSGFQLPVSKTSRIYLWFLGGLQNPWCFDVSWVSLKKRPKVDRITSLQRLRLFK